MDQGLFLFTIGKRTDRCDWVHVDNLVTAHLLVRSPCGRQHAARLRPKHVGCMHEWEWDACTAPFHPDFACI